MRPKVLAILIASSAALPAPAIAQDLIQIKSVSDGRCIEAVSGSLKLRDCINQPEQRVDITNTFPIKFLFHLGGGDACAKVEPGNQILTRSCTAPVPGWNIGFGKETKIELFSPTGGDTLCMDFGRSSFDPNLIELTSCSDDDPKQKWQVMSIKEPF